VSGVPEPSGLIVMITRNRARRVGDTVARLLTLPERWPVIVVDDASEDDTADRLVERFGDEISVVRLVDRRGPSARNSGVELATTPLVAFADDDSWWAPGSLARAADVFDAHPAVGLIAATVVVEPDASPDPIVASFVDSGLPVTDAGPAVLGFLACGAVVRRSAFLGVGGFHRLLAVGGEEEQLALDLRAAGWSLVHVPAVVAHHGPDHHDGGRGERAARMAGNHVLVRWMRRPLHVAAAATVVTGARAVRDAPSRRALLRAVRALPAALADRRRIPRPVEAEVRQLTQSRWR
jgi:glycosyltransferase involved in cell wall biosynthesis